MRVVDIEKGMATCMKPSSKVVKDMDQIFFFTTRSAYLFSDELPLSNCSIIPPLMVIICVSFLKIYVSLGQDKFLSAGTKQKFAKFYPLIEISLSS
uniref:Uncharacterized protein n=1 Tax=Rhizophora mucronata TaxID=61149 RepID=A0A2P2QYA9_RHIMU